MRKMPGLDPTTLPQANTNSPIVGVGTAFNSGMTSSCGALYFKNKSNVGVNIVFDDGTSAEIPAWHARLFPMQKRINQLWLSQAYMLNIAKSPISQLDYEAYQANEDTTGLYTGPINYRTTIGNQLGTAQSVDAVLETAPTVSITTNAAQSFTLFAAGLNLAGVSPQSPGYLVLGFLNTHAGQNAFLPTRGNRESYSAIQAYSIPANSTGNVQSFSFLGPNSILHYLTAIQIQSLNSNITITNVEVKRTTEPVGSYVSVLPGAVVGSASVTSIVIKLPDYWGPEGFGSLAATGGFNIRITANNAAGVAATPTLSFYGVQLAYDEAEIVLSYVDWNNNNYDLGHMKLGQLLTLPLDFLVPIPITDPSQTNFGKLVFTVLSSKSFYNTSYILNAVIPCFVSFLALQ